MISRQQSILIHTAVRDIRKANPAYDDAAYRTTLRTIAGVASSKDLTNSTFEQVLAFFESVGWRDPSHPAGYWQAQADRGGGRQEYSVEGLCRKYGIGGAYLGGIIERITHGRTDRVEGCNAYEQGKIIEALKAIGNRNAPQASAPAATPPRPLTEKEIAQIEEDELLL